MSSHARLGREEVETPIIHIESRRSEQVPRSNFVRSMPGPNVDKSLPPPPAAPERPNTGPPVLESSIIPLGTDLSTILESETSGISGHIPPLDESQDDPRPFPKFSNPADSSMLRAPSSSGRKSTGQESDGMDLSTSDLRNEVLDALKQDGAAKNWSNGVIVDDPNDSIPPSTRPSPGAEQFLRGKEPSFDLESLDPDLAALLSPNKFAGSEPALVIAPSSASLRSQSPESKLVASGSSTPLNASTSSSTGQRSPTSAVQTLGTHAPRRPSYHSRTSASTASSSSSSLPRLVRPGATHLSPVFVDDSPGLDSPSYVQSDPTITNDPLGRPSSSSENGSRRRHPPSPLREAHPEPPLEKQNTGDGWPSRKPPPQSRYTTPARPSTALSSTSTSRLRHFPIVSVSGWDPDGASPSSRASSVLASSATRRPHEARPSMDNLGRASVDKDRMTHVRTRRRSASLGGNYLPQKSGTTSMTRSATDWLGPRTQKAFAAAGLLGHDREGGGSSQGGSMSRYGSVRSAMSDRDSRSQYAPSRMAFSEVSGSVSSWGGRSGRVPTPDGQIRPSDSPTFTTRTFSPSTAPTSLSAASSVHQQHQTEVETLKEKHAMETEALLSALADSQRTTKVLREENAELRDRVSNLESRLDELLEQFRRQQSAPPPPITSSQHFQMSRNVFSRPVSTEAVFHRGSASTSGLSPRIRDRSPREATRPTPEDRRVPPAPWSGTHRRRSSTTSSVFQLPPSNMSMLLHEEGEAANASRTTSLHSAPPSPTLVARILNTGNAQSSTKAVPHAAGNTSPTSTSFSIMPGSPGSLSLRTEHELHLDDLASFRLDYGEDDDSLSQADER
ncbi:hypothetical protein GLOTRDRAFT_138432 [Gloeophyllum trabeum ATCC 11539]|uniref:Uncharacterized protein n=1 Tax=Gloeophyllum trabeum (strain ATCC 11539 / FP-39264 / Madison 617) TaxID=670483 RepID=S7Q661_GLOTA|nr:uncharacterized protein GLOTRDRAFT_138432 [Gloeophyllum trabeum ATCC 11539]EPQ55531.1 hypothetical protein GLOTRDRAFT_138432 [Gloeophyllum trabeum ATCC 11539]